MLKRIAMKLTSSFVLKRLCVEFLVYVDGQEPLTTVLPFLLLDEWKVLQLQILLSIVLDFHVMDIDISTLGMFHPKSSLMESKCVCWKKLGLTTIYFLMVTKVAHPLVPLN
jgi:hypothetical protein